MNRNEQVTTCSNMVRQHYWVNKMNDVICIVVRKIEQMKHVRANIFLRFYDYYSWVGGSLHEMLL